LLSTSTDSSSSASISSFETSLLLSTLKDSTSWTPYSPSASIIASDEMKKRESSSHDPKSSSSFQSSVFQTDTIVDDDSFPYWVWIGLGIFSIGLCAGLGFIFAFYQKRKRFRIRISQQTNVSQTSLMRPSERFINHSHSNFAKNIRMLPVNDSTSKTSNTLTLSSQKRKRFKHFYILHSEILKVLLADPTFDPNHRTAICSRLPSYGHGQGLEL
jgi:hypothetical protein